MSATNHTSNYNLNQFIGTDKPSWLVDYNGDMLSIDTAMKANQTAAGAAQSKADTADGKADANALAITTLDNQINTPSTGLASIVADHTTVISGIAGKIGNTPLTTVAQTLTGAIEEVKSDANTAITAVNTKINGMRAYISDQTFTTGYDGTITIKDQINDLITQLKAWVIANPGKLYEYDYILIAGVNLSGFLDHVKSAYDNFYFTGIALSTLETVLRQVAFFDSGNASYIVNTSGTTSDESLTVADSTAVLSIKVYQVIS